MPRRGESLLSRHLSVAVVLAVLGVHAWLVVENIDMDADTLRVAGRLARVGSFSESLSDLGPKVILYAIQPPLLWAATRGLAVMHGGWNQLSTARLLTIMSLTAIACLLWTLARDAGAGPWGRAGAAVAPFCWHGFSFLAAGCDDNVPADVLRLAAVLAGVRWMSVPPGGRRHIALGLVLGAALCWHFQSVLLLPAVAVTGALAWRRDGSRRMQEAAVALAVAIAVWLAVVFVCARAGKGPVPSVSAMGAATVENHRDPNLWARPPALQSAAVAEGWSRMVLGYGWLRPEGWWAAVAVSLATCLMLGAASARTISETPLWHVAWPVLAIQAAHSLLYESESIERWDLPALLWGLLGAAAVARLRSGREARILAAGLAGAGIALAACSATAYIRFASRAESAFLDVVTGKREIPDLSLTCPGAHRRLCLAARTIAAEIPPDMGRAGFAQAGAPDAYHLHWLTNWFTSYVVCYAPGLFDRPGPARIVFSLLYPPPPGEFRVLRNEGFVWLAGRVTPR